MNAEKATEQIFQLFENYGNADYIGEPVSQVEHALQAAKLAEEAGYEDEVVLAALLHDIGHLVALSKGGYQSMSGFGAASHEDIGVQYLKSLGIDGNILLLVQSHVAAKRYLVSKHEDYFNQLSEASKQTFQHQGGKMSTTEMEAFEQHPLFHLFIKMREWDDKAKLENYTTNDIEAYKKICLTYLKKIKGD